jgi:hypothetical protein
VEGFVTGVANCSVCGAEWRVSHKEEDGIPEPYTCPDCTITSLKRAEGKCGKGSMLKGHLFAVYCDKDYGHDLYPTFEYDHSGAYSGPVYWR